MGTFSLNSFVAGVMLGIIGTAVWFTSWDALTLSALQPPMAASASGTEQAPGSDTVVVTAQAAGLSVVVASVTVPPPGVWVAVRETNGTELENVLGAARVTGPGSNIPVPLMRATEPGAAYAIEFYRDNGDDAFDLATDSVYVDFTTSAPVIAYFNTTAK